MCNCDPRSAFHWKDNPRPSIFRGADWNYGADAEAGGKGRRETSVENKQRTEERLGHELSNVIDGKVLRRAGR